MRTLTQNFAQIIKSVIYKSAIQHRWTLNLINQQLSHQLSMLHSFSSLFWYLSQCLSATDTIEFGHCIKGCAADFWIGLLKYDYMNLHNPVWGSDMPCLKLSLGYTDFTRPNDLLSLNTERSKFNSVTVISFDTSLRHLLITLSLSKTRLNGLIYQTQLKIEPLLTF